MRMQFARDMDPALADKFIGMYVNKWTLDYGEEGRRAVRELLRARRGHRTCTFLVQGGVPFRGSSLNACVCRRRTLGSRVAFAFAGRMPRTIDANRPPSLTRCFVHNFFGALRQEHATDSFHIPVRKSSANHHIARRYRARRNFESWRCSARRSISPIGLPQTVRELADGARRNIVSSCIRCIRPPSEIRRRAAKAELPFQFPTQSASVAGCG